MNGCKVLSCCSLLEFSRALDLCCLLRETKGSPRAVLTYSALFPDAGQTTNLALLGHKGPQTPWRSASVVLCAPTRRRSEDPRRGGACTGCEQERGASTHQPVSDPEQLVLGLDSVADVLPVG